MKKNKFLSALVAIVIGLVLWAPGTLAAAFGVSPPWITNESLKPGSNFVYVIDLSSNELPEDMIINAEFSGDPEITEWLTIQNKGNLVMTKGRSIVPMSVSMNIPKDAKLGKYQGSLMVTLTPKNGLEEGITVLLGGNIKIELNVINYDVTDYTIHSIDANNITEGQAINLELKRIKNLGNTVITNVMTKVSIVEARTDKKVVNISADTLNTPVYPHTTVDAGLSFPALDLKAGDYWLNVESFKDGESIYENRIYFTVEPSTANNALKTAVQVAPEGGLKPAAFEEGQSDTKTSIQTSVRVRAPYTDKLIMVVIGILIVLTGIVVKFYLHSKKRRR